VRSTSGSRRVKKVPGTAPVERMHYRPAASSKTVSKTPSHRTISSYSARATQAVTPPVRSRATRSAPRMPVKASRNRAPQSAPAAPARRSKAPERRATSPSPKRSSPAKRKAAAPAKRRETHDSRPSGSRGDTRSRSANRGRDN
jgi:hypothetical protein